jgi:CheY-like chemotaxis protein
MTCSSEPGRGSTFTVYLPVIEAEAEAEVEADPNASTESEPPMSGGEQILVIDDDELVRRSLRRYLEHYGYRVLMAENGEEGVTLFAERQPKIDLIILDLSMPKMSGVEVLAAIRELDAGVKVIVATGFASEQASLPVSVHRKTC